MVVENRSTPSGDPSSGPVLQGRLRVEVSVSENVDSEPELAYRLQIAVTSYENADPNIFVYQSVPQVAGGTADVLSFVTVATPPYMQELPIGEPDPDSNYMCRLSSADLYFRTAQEVSRAQASLLRRITLLLDSLERLAVLRPSLIIDYEFSTDEENASSTLG